MELVKLRPGGPAARRPDGKDEIMNKYVNVPCAKCGKPFTEDDDVVVCPDCGAPHHRSCYYELGHCALEENHAAGVMWQDPRKPEGSAATVACPRCGALNLADAQYCSTCGTPLDGSYQGPGSVGYGGVDGGYQRPSYEGGDGTQGRPGEPQPIMTPLGPIHYDDDFDGVTAQEIAAFVGPNYRRYLSVFKMMKESGRGFSFNWSGFFFSYCFLFYRKLYRPAIVVMSIMAMLFVPRMIYASETMKYILNVYMDVAVSYDMALITNLEGIISITNILQLALMFLLAAFSDKVYYNHVIGEIKKLRQAAPATIDQEQFLSMLAVNGRTNGRLGYGMALLTAAVIFGVSYLITYNILAGVVL